MIRLMMRKYNELAHIPNLVKETIEKLLPKFNGNTSKLAEKLAEEIAQKLKTD